MDQPKDVGATAGFPFEHVEGVEGDRGGRGCERGERREAVQEIKRSCEGLEGGVHDAKSEVHALRACEKRKVWCRKVEGGVEIGNSGAKVGCI